MDQVREFFEMLRDPNPGVRRFALQRLSEVGERDVLPLLHSAVRDPDDAVALQAERSLRILQQRSMRAAPLRRARDPRLIPFGNLNNARGAERLVRLRDAGLEVLADCTRSLIQLLDSARPRVVRAAAIALGKIGDPMGIDPLGQTLHREEVSQEAAMALAAIEDPRVIDLLMALLRTRDKRLIRVTMYALDSLRDERVIEGLLGLTEHPDAEIRADAVYFLGDLGDSSTCPKIEHLLHDPQESVALRCLEALRKLNHPGVVEEVVRRFDATSDKKVRATLLMCLLHHPLEESVIALLSRALEDEDARVRANAVDAVASLKAPSARKLKLLEKIGNDENNRVLANVAMALGPIEPVKSLQILTRLLNSGNKWERASAVYAAGFIKEVKVGFWLANALFFEEDEDVIRNIVTSLSRFRDRALLERLQSGLKHTRPTIRFACARVLGNMQDRLAKKWLSEALATEAEPTVRAELLTALSRVADVSQITMIARFLQDGDPRVQANALDAMERLGSLEIVPYIRPLLFSLDNRVKANAAKALFGQGELDVVNQLRVMLDSGDEGERLSAIFALGEIGLALHSLTDTHRYYLLCGALEMRSEASKKPEEQKAFSLSDSDQLQQFFTNHWEMIGAYLKGDHEKTLELVEKLLKESPTHPLGQFIKGEIYRSWEDHERAIHHLQISEAHDAGFLGVLTSMANLYNNQGQTRDGVVYYLKTLREKLAIFTDEINLALGLVKSDRLTEASMLLKSLVAQVPIDPKTHYNVGQQALRYGDREKAFRHLSLAILADPHDVEACLELILAARKLGQPELARQLEGHLHEVLPPEDSRRARLETANPGREPEGTST